jgi:hypothetical protein
MSKQAFIAGVSVVLVIIILPLISFYYLRQGLSFRVSALDALEQSEEESKLTEEVTKLLAIEKGIVNVLIKEHDFETDKIDDLYAKFKGNQYFLLHTFYEGDEQKSSAILGKNHTQSKILKEQMSLFESAKIILIDTSGQVRGTYGNDESDFKQFIRHLSVLLPVQRSRTVVLER